MSRRSRSSTFRSSIFRPSTPVFEGSSIDFLSLTNAFNQNHGAPQLPQPAHVEPPPARHNNDDRRRETFSSMFSDCGFLVNDGTKRMSVASKRQSAASSNSNPRDRWSFLDFRDNDVLELAPLGQRDSLSKRDSHFAPLGPRDSVRHKDSQFTALPEIPEHHRDLESPTTLVGDDDDDNMKYLEGSQLARLPLVEGKALWALVIV